MSKGKNNKKAEAKEKPAETAVKEVLMEPVVEPIVEAPTPAKKDVVGIRNLTRRVLVVPSASGVGIHIGPKEQVQVSKSEIGADAYLFEAQGRVRIIL